MSKKQSILFIIPVLLIAILLGPTVDTSFTPKIYSIEDPEKYIQEEESKIQNLRENTNKLILWNNPELKNQTDYSIIFLHGYSASRMELHPIPENLAKNLGANIFLTRMSGHGAGVDDLGYARVNDWLNDAREAIAIGKILGKRVLFIGNSTGATLGNWLMGQKEGESIYTYIFISPNFHPKDPFSDLALLPWGNLLVRLTLGEYREWKPKNAEIAKYWNYKTPYKAILNLMGLVKVAEKVDVSQVRTPLLIIYSPEDRVISAKEVERKFEIFGSNTKKLVPFTESEDSDQHILGGNIVSPSTNNKLNDIILSFLYSIQ